MGKVSVSSSLRRFHIPIESDSGFSLCEITQRGSGHHLDLQQRKGRLPMDVGQSLSIRLGPVECGGRSTRK